LEIEPKDEVVKIEEKGSPAKTKEQIDKLIIRNPVKNPDNGDDGKNER